MENKIILKFGNSIRDLTGNTLGRKTYQVQVEPYILDDALNVVIIPEEIEDIGSSFIQGIYTTLKEQYGKAGALEHMVLQSNRNNVVNKIEKSIKVYGI